MATAAAKPNEQSPNEIAQAIELFFTDHASAAVLEDGRPLFDMRSARYSLSLEHGRCTLQLWNEERNIVRRIVAYAARKDSLRLATMRFGQTKPQMLDLISKPDRREGTDRDNTRRRYAELLERVLQQYFEGWAPDAFRHSMDLEQSFGPAYARGLLLRGQNAWAVVGISAGETQSTIDGILTVGILWMKLCREQAAGRRLVQGIRLVVPEGTAATTLSRMAWLRGDAAQWELYEFNERAQTLTLRDAADTGNLTTRLMHIPNPERAHERFAASIARALQLVADDMQPRVEVRLRSAAEAALLLHGLEFARIRHTASVQSFLLTTEISFGAGAQETPLNDATEPMLREFVARLFSRRHSRGSQKDPLFRMQPEAWLEAELRRNISPLTDGQNSLAQFDTDHVYAQVPAFQAGDRGMLDLLTVTRDSRLAVLELKASEDMHFALQGLDYWLRVRWHHTQSVDPSTGLGALQQHGYFSNMRLSPQAPRLYLVAPSLRIHPATETVLRYLKPEVEWTLLGLNEKWREGIKVITRVRSNA